MWLIFKIVSKSLHCLVFSCSTQKLSSIKINTQLVKKVLFNSLKLQQVNYKLNLGRFSCSFQITIIVRLD